MTIRIVLLNAHFIGIQFTIAFADGLDQAVAGDRIANRRIDDLVQAALGTEDRVDRLLEFDRVGYAPTGEGIHPDVGFFQCRDLAGVAIPEQQIFGVFVDFVEERQAKIEARIRYRLPDDLAESCYDDLFGFIHHEGGCI